LEEQHTFKFNFSEEEEDEKKEEQNFTSDEELM
jgi:hypothetical protein